MLNTHCTCNFLLIFQKWVGLFNFFAIHSTSLKVCNIINKFISLAFDAILMCQLLIVDTPISFCIFLYYTAMILGQVLVLVVLKSLFLAHFIRQVSIIHTFWAYKCLALQIMFGQYLTYLVISELCRYSVVQFIASLAQCQYTHGCLWLISQIIEPFARP